MGGRQDRKEGLTLECCCSADRRRRGALCAGPGQALLSPLGNGGHGGGEERGGQSHGECGHWQPGLRQRLAERLRYVCSSLV